MIDTFAQLGLTPLDSHVSAFRLDAEAAVG